jgi:hypothetical protein
MPRDPKNALQPEDLLHFIELRAFTLAWDGELGLTDADLLALQMPIMIQPKAAPLVKGTGGLRKLRFRPKRWSTGKRGSVRVCYVHYEQFGIVLLVTAYSKNRKDDLSAQEKQRIRKLIKDIEIRLK